MSMSRLVVAFGGEREWVTVGKAGLMLSQYNDLKGILNNPESKPFPFYELAGSWGPTPGHLQRLLVQVSDIKGLGLQTGIEDPVSE